MAQTTIVLDDSARLYHDERTFSIRMDAARAYSVDDLDDPSFLTGFQVADKGDFNIGVTSAAVWLRFTVRNISGQRWLLRAGNPTSQEVTLYVPQGPGVCDSTILSFDRPIRERPWRINQYLFDLRVPKGGEQSYFVRIISRNPISDRPMIGTARSFFAREQRRDMWAGVYLGLILVMVLYNLFIYISTLDRSFLFYGIYVLSIGLLVSMHDAYPFALFWPEAPWINLSMPLLAAMGGAFAALFTTAFLHTRERVPGLHKGLIAILVFYAASGMLVFTGHYRFAVVIQQIAGFSSVYVWVVAFVVYRQGFKPARYYLLAWTFLVFGVSIYVIGALGFIDLRTMGIDALQIGTAAEAMMLSFALADRFNQYKAEKEALMTQQQEVLERKVAERTLALESEKRRSEDLLLNILPAQVAEELRDHGRMAARDYEQVTVMFTDFKDFTRIGEVLPAAQLIRDLDLLFSAFDRIIQKYGLEKIKTIGDAYMCAGGLPDPCPSHAHDVVRAGIEIRDFMLQDRQRRIGSGQVPFEVRIGIHTGPVVAGIVGVKKFAYDIWGDTVNLASRMEGSGEVGRVNISGSTHAIIKHDFACVHRGRIATKNKAEVDMYFVEPK